MAERGPHGVYLIRRSALAAIKPPRRFRRRRLKLADLEWTWLALGQEADQGGAHYEQLRAIGLIRRRPKLAKGLARLFDVQRLRLGGLTAAEIAGLLGISKRHVRRLTWTDLQRALDGARASARESPRDELYPEEAHVHGVVEVLNVKLRRQRARAARRTVANIQRRLASAGFRYHQRARRADDMFVTPVPPRAFNVTELDRAVVRRLLDAGLTSDEIEAIELVGIGSDELNELILNGLPPKTEP